MNECKEHKYRVQGEITDGDCPCCRIAELEQQLARYQGAVEVEGKVYYSGDYCWVESDIFPDGYELPNGRRVTLLVMKEVG